MDSHITAIQRQLERIYEIDVPHDVSDFLITDPDVVKQIDDAPHARHLPEKLLVKQVDEDVELALYLDTNVVGRLERDDPRERLHRGNLDDFCTALEGVSHFLYLTWNAGYGRGVSLLELELQAEVDKYVSTAFLFGQQDNGRIPRRLHEWLFENALFDSELCARDLTRYRDASHYAGRFCSRLQERYFRRRRTGLINELRRFYRLRQVDKIKRIEAVA